GTSDSQANSVACIHIGYVDERARFIDTPNTKENRATAFNPQQDRSVWWVGAGVLESRKVRQGVFPFSTAGMGSFSGVSDPTFGPLSHWMSRVIISMA